ncbi:hypothetical protein LINPERPRIM_LOCUS25314 [Linum perenne]
MLKSLKKDGVLKSGYAHYDLVILGGRLSGRKERMSVWTAAFSFLS